MITKTKYIPQNDIDTKNLPFIDHSNPEDVYIGQADAATLSVEMLVKEGDTVKMGQVIGKRTARYPGGPYEINIHSTVSGTVVGTVKKFDRTGKLSEFTHIKNDKKDTKDPSIKKRTDAQIAKLKKEDFINITKDLSLVGLGGSGFPTFIKFATPDEIDTIVVNNVECEPYLATDYMGTLKFVEELYTGVKYALQAFGAKKARIAIKKKNKKLIEHVKEVAARDFDLDIKVIPVGNHYPSGWEIQTIKQATGIQVPLGTLPSKLGVMVFNSSTLISLYNAVRNNSPLTHRIVTVIGEGINNPQIYDSRIGVEASELIKLSGGYNENGKNKVLILGGPMMGTSFVRDDFIMEKTGTSIIVKNHVTPKEEPCVRCAACVYSCPVGIRPVDISYAVRSKDVDRLKKLDINRCMQCGLCSYTCTSKIHLTEDVRKARRMVTK